MRFLRKIKQEVLPAVKAGWANNVSARIDFVQTRIAVYLNGRTANLTVRGKWVFLVLVCLLFGGFSLYLLVKALL